MKVYKRLIISTLYKYYPFFPLLPKHDNACSTKNKSPNAFRPFRTTSAASWKQRMARGFSPKTSGYAPRVGEGAAG